MSPPTEVNPGQRWRAASYVAHAGFVADLGAPTLELLAPGPNEAILDLGCGDGRLTERIAAAGARVIGFDAAFDLVVASRRRGLSVVLGDGHALPFAPAFDAVFSNAALHWMPRAAEVIDGVRRALKPQGRFVGEMGGHGNVAEIVSGMVGALARHGIDGRPRIPWYFPTAADYSRLLEQGGFHVTQIELFRRPTPLPTGMEGWLETFANPFLVGVPSALRAEILADAIDRMAPSLRDGEGNWTADYVRLRFSAALV